MPKTMLIDAAHAEETRVVVVDGNRVEEFDFESQNRKQLRGNIYLAKVTRVEPSLQAAFVEYGGTAMASSPSTKSTPTTTRSRSPTAKPCSAKRPRITTTTSARHGAAAATAATPKPTAMTTTKPKPWVRTTTTT